MFCESRNDRRRRICARAVADRLRDCDATGIGDNSTEIGDNSVDIGDGIGRIVAIAANVIPC